MPLFLTLKSKYFLDAGLLGNELTKLLLNLEFVRKVLGFKQIRI